MATQNGALRELLLDVSRNFAVSEQHELFDQRVGLLQLLRFYSDRVVSLTVNVEADLEGRGVDRE